MVCTVSIFNKKRANVTKRPHSGLGVVVCRLMAACLECVANGTTIFDLKRSPCRVYPFELYLNLFLMCAWLCFYFLSLFDVLFVARAFSYFLFARACIIVLYIQLTLDVYFILTVIILFSLPILAFVQ